MEGAVSERRKTFAVTHRSDKDRQAYISAFPLASSVIGKAKTEAWQTTCSSLLPKSVYSLLRSVAGSSFSSPRKSALIFADYQRSHFSISND